MAIALSLSATTIYGQGSTPASHNATTSSQTAVGDDYGNRREHHNYGWIGLLGLVGLTGLMRKRHDHNSVDYSDRPDSRRSMAGSHS